MQVLLTVPCLELYISGPVSLHFWLVYNFCSFIEFFVGYNDCSFFFSPHKVFFFCFYSAFLVRSTSCAAIDRLFFWCAIVFLHAKSSTWMSTHTACLTIVLSELSCCFKNRNRTWKWGTRNSMVVVTANKKVCILHMNG